VSRDEKTPEGGKHSTCSRLEKKKKERDPTLFIETVARKIYQKNVPVFLEKKKYSRRAKKEKGKSIKKDAPRHHIILSGSRGEEGARREPYRSSHKQKAVNGPRKGKMTSRNPPKKKKKKKTKTNKKKSFPNCHFGKIRERKKRGVNRRQERRRNQERKF